MTAVIENSTNPISKPELLFNLGGLGCEIFDAIFIPGKQAIVTGAEDRTLRVWMRRDTGKFWPSAVEVLPSPITCVTYCAETQHIYLGLDNGTVVDFVLSEDLNHLAHKRDFLSHTARVMGVFCASDIKCIISTSRDRTVAFYSMDTGKRLCGHQLEASGTCLAYDTGSRYTFVGDDTGRITLLGLSQSNNQTSCSAVRELRVHDQAVTSLSWDSLNSRLFSSSADKSIILWDIGGAKGTALEFQGHLKEATSVIWWPGGNNKRYTSGAANEAQLKGLAVSGGLDGRLVFWFMNPGRMESPNWSESDVCQLCGSPFFWNVKKMWDIMSVGVRQHHCRRCGKAVCDKCSLHRSPLPIMGFERDVRMCNVCYPSITDLDRRSLAITFDTRHPVTRVRIEEGLKLILTVGKDRSVKVWDVESMT